MSKGQNSKSDTNKVPAKTKKEKKAAKLKKKEEKNNHSLLEGMKK